MNKKYNIHDWQAKQRQLSEIKEETINEISQEVVNIVNNLIRSMVKKFGPNYSEQDAVFAIMAALRQRGFKGVNEHHAGDYKPGFLKQSVNTFLDKLKKKTKEGKDYKTVEKIMEKYFSAKKKNEASMTSSNVKFTPGSSGAGPYATPKAFGDNKRKKKKGYMGYKEI